jgi:hypothetical protein
MTKKDYVLIADTISRSLEQMSNQHDLNLAQVATVKTILISYFENSLSNTNPLFNYDKFQTYIDEHCRV